MSIRKLYIRLSSLQLPCRVLVIFLVGIVQIACATTNPTDDTIGDVSIQQLTTPAGNKYWYYPMPKSDRTALAVTWSTDLPKFPNGLESTPRLGIALMLNGGAGGLDAEKIIADFEDLDSGSQLWVQPQEISGFIVSPDIHTDKAAEIANLVLTQPNFDEQWFTREKKNLIDAAKERESTVFGLAWNLSREMTLGDHPYKRFWSLAPLDGVEAVSLDNVKEWHSKAFSTDGISITAAGNSAPEKISASIDRVLMGLKNHPTVNKRQFDAPRIPAKTVVLHRPEAGKSAILIVGNLPQRSVETTIPLQLGMGVLGLGKQSRLFKAVRSGLRAAYGFSAGTFDMTRQHTIIHISGEVETQKLQLALNETAKTYEKFRADGIGPVEFPIARRFYRQRITEEFTKPASVAYMMMESNLNNFGTSYMPSLLSQIKAQERSAVNSVIKESFPSFDSLLKIIVTPDPNAIADACVIQEPDEWQQCL